MKHVRSCLRCMQKARCSEETLKRDPFFSASISLFSNECLIIGLKRDTIAGHAQAIRLRLSISVCTEQLRFKCIPLYSMTLEVLMQCHSCAEIPIIKFIEKIPEISNNIPSSQKCYVKRLSALPVLYAKNSQFCFIS